MRCRLLLLVTILLPGAAMGQSITPNFTQGSMTSTTSTTQSISETIQTQVYGGNYRSVSAMNVTPSGDINAPGTTFSVTTAGNPFSLEVVSRSAGLVEQTDITRTINTTATTQSLSVFSQ